MCSFWLLLVITLGILKKDAPLSRPNIWSSRQQHKAPFSCTPTYAPNDFWYCDTVCVCVSVSLSVCYHTSGGIVHFYVPTNVPIASIWNSLGFLARGFWEVMVPFAYLESHHHYYRDPELIPSTAQGYKVVQKPNQALNATWNTS